MRAKKSLGQHFLMHRAIAERMVLGANLPEGATVLEVGPGHGVLTRVLLAHAKKVVAVEADRELVEELSLTFRDEIAEGSLELIGEDIRSFDEARLPAGYHVIANIPYYLSGELFRRFLESAHQPSSMTFLVQKEVAERIARSTKESLLSLSVKAYGTPAYLFTVPRGAFTPPPKIDSAVLSVRDISRGKFASRAVEERFFTLIRAGFAHKRKLLSNNLRSIGIETPDRYGSKRAEDLSLADWLALSEPPSTGS